MSETIDATRTDLAVESSYVEDDAELNILVSPKLSQNENQGDPEPRWTIVVNPKTKEIIRVDFCVASNEGFEYPDYKPTEKQMALFKQFVAEISNGRENPKNS